MTDTERMRRYRAKKGLRPMTEPDDRAHHSLVIRCQDLEQRLTDAGSALHICERDRWRGELPAPGGN